MMQNHAEWGLSPIGVFPEREARAVLEAGGIDDMIFIVDRQRLESCEDVFLLCEEQGVTVRVVLKLFPHSIARIGFHELDGYPLLTFSTTPSNEFLLFVRRVLDVLLSMILLVPASVAIGVAAIAIKLSSPGPVFFCQTRCGLHGRPFTMYKLRSMINDAEQRRVELESINEMDGPVFKSSRDPRVTNVGRVLRRFSIDEFPQLFNVVRGEMSLVGPRPPLPAEVERYERWQRRRLSMKPGITCLWQISGRNQIGFEEWMRLDLNYIDNWSLLLDLKILLKTVPVVLLGRGAR
jgi:exopolysaccharide biosynthesis polyprenyl glycosylphosphotransferase